MSQLNNSPPPVRATALCMSKQILTWMRTWFVICESSMIPNARDTSRHCNELRIGWWSNILHEKKALSSLRSLLYSNGRQSIGENFNKEDYIEWNINHPQPLAWRNSA